jgi:hypothetical protein
VKIKKGKLTPHVSLKTVYGSIGSASGDIAGGCDLIAHTHSESQNQYLRYANDDGISVMRCTHPLAQSLQ